MSNKAVVLDDRREVRLYDHGVAVRLAGYLRGQERRLGVAVAAIIVYAVTVAALPWIIRQVVDSHIPAGDKSAVDLAALAFAAVVTVQFVTNYLHRRLDAFVGQEILYRLRTDLFDHVQRLSMSFFDRNEAGRVMSRVQNDTRDLEGFVSVIVLTVADILSLAGIVAAMVAMSPSLAAVTLTVVPLLIAVIWVWQRLAREPRMRARTRRPRRPARLLCAPDQHRHAGAGPLHRDHQGEHTLQPR